MSRCRGSTPHQLPIEFGLTSGRPRPPEDGSTEKEAGERAGGHDRLMDGKAGWVAHGLSLIVCGLDLAYQLSLLVASLDIVHQFPVEKSLVFHPNFYQSSFFSLNSKIE